MLCVDAYKDIKIISFNFDDLIRPLCVSECWRVVETQEIAATMSITSNSADQARLEQLLDDIKPPIPSSYNQLSYLMYTPFRYPPLRHGSRYGSTWERGIFYGSRRLVTALAETAVYFWLFQQGMKTLGPATEIQDYRTAFAVPLSSEKAMDLTAKNFGAVKEKLTSTHSWEFTQKVGTALREHGVEFWLFPSARLADQTNIAVVSDKAFFQKKPSEQQQWHCKLTQTHCIFARAGAKSIEFKRSDFEIEGRIPHPAL